MRNHDDASSGSSSSPSPSVDNGRLEDQLEALRDEIRLLRSQGRHHALFLNTAALVQFLADAAAFVRDALQCAVTPPNVVDDAEDCTLPNGNKRRNPPLGMVAICVCVLSIVFGFLGSTLNNTQDECRVLHASIDIQTILDELRSAQNDTKAVIRELKTVQDENRRIHAKFDTMAILKNALDVLPIPYHIFNSMEIAKPVPGMIALLICVLPIIFVVLKKYIAAFYTGSNILLISEMDQIQKWLKEENVEGSTELLYCASRDGWGAADFHSRCDGRGATVTVVQSTGGHVFGGFTDTPWASDGYRKASPKAFLFGLRTHCGLGPTKMCQNGSNPGYAVICHGSFGPLFGGGNVGNDICIADNANTNSNSFTNVSDTYQCPPGQNGQTFLTGAKNFQAAEVEIFCIG